MTEFGGGGAFEAGPWINSEEKTWDSTKKISVQGAVKRESTFSAEVEGDMLHIKGNGIPPTEMGNFPVASSDPAYQYDRNPNSIKPYTLEVSLPAEPKQAEEATCVGGAIGVSTLGPPIYSAFDAAGRDASAYEIQDSCGGHPERTGQYHFHSLPACWEKSDLSKSGLVGWALDGFGIFVERDADGNMLQTSDLDECHGRTSEIQWNGKPVNVYHYVATMDFPYLVGCYRGTPISSATGINIRPPR